MKTFSQCCDEIAKKHGYKTLIDMPRNRIVAYKEAAQLSREEGIRDAAVLGAQMELNSDGTIAGYSYSIEEIVDKLKA